MRNNHFKDDLITHIKNKKKNKIKFHPNQFPNKLWTNLKFKNVTITQRVYEYIKFVSYFLSSIRVKHLKWFMLFILVADKKNKNKHVKFDRYDF